MMIVAIAPIDAAEWITRRERVRSMRMQRHFAVAAVAGLAFVFLLSTSDSMLEMALIPTSAAVALQSVVRGASAGFGYLWGWPYPEPVSSTRLDRIVEAIVAPLVARRRVPTERGEERITLLDPWEA